MKQRLLIAGVITLLGTGSAFAATNGQMELSKAMQQAKLGGHAASLQQVDNHLHKIMNCLEGPSSPEFDAKAGNPCMGEGHGAANDFKNGRVGKDEMTQAMLDIHYGLMTPRVKIAQNASDLAYNSLASAKAGD